MRRDQQAEGGGKLTRRWNIDKEGPSLKSSQEACKELMEIFLN